MKYPYVTMIKKYKKQIIMEICNEFNNYRIIIQKDNLFDTTLILKQKYAQTEKQKFYQFLIFINLITLILRQTYNY